MMKKIVVLLSALFLSSCSKVQLDQEEMALIESLGINAQQAIKLKTYAEPKALLPLAEPGNGWNTSDLVGISFNADERKVPKIFDLRNQLREDGFLLFRSQMNFGYEPEQFSVIKSDDQYDILRYSGTDGANYDLLPEDIIAKLKEWEERYPFEITGANLDWLEAELIDKGQDLSELAQQVYEFCPDVVDQGTGSVEALEKEMEAGRTLYLWWD